MTHMKSTHLLPVIAITAFGICTHVCGYEIDTHANITSKAFDKSAIAQNSRLIELGLYKSRKLSKLMPSDGLFQIDHALGQKYFDLSGGVAKPRYAATYDAVNSAVMKRDSPAPIQRWAYTSFDGQDIPYFPRDWMARGAVREDDAGLISTQYTAWSDTYALNTLDASPLMDRFCNHFYDPINDRGLQLSVSFGLILCNNNASNIAWALGNSNANADGSGAADVNRINGFSIRDAREAMWRALTGTNGQGVNVAPDRETRDAYWATTFRSLENT